MAKAVYSSPVCPLSWEELGARALSPNSALPAGGLFAAIQAQMGTVEFGYTGTFLTRLGEDNSIRFEVILTS